MGKAELRAEFIERCEATGDLDRELVELSKFKEATEPSELVTITVGCSELLSLICC